MVRVAGLMGQAAAGFGVRSPDGRFPEEALAEIRDRVLELSAEQSKLWNRELRPALDEEGIFIRRVAECDEAELAELSERFERDVYPCSRRSRSAPASVSRTSRGSRSAWGCSCATPRPARSDSRV